MALKQVCRNSVFHGVSQENGFQAVMNFLYKNYLQNGNYMHNNTPLDIDEISGN